MYPVMSALLYSITKGLEKDKITTVSGRFKWYPNKMKQILENEKYIGDVRLNKYITPDVFLEKLSKTKVKLIVIIKI